MFTGIVEEMGTLSAKGQGTAGLEMTFSGKKVLEGTALGDSIAVNGVCLTVTRFDQRAFTVGVAPETLKRTNLGDLRMGQAVNLERAVTPTTRLGGHYVQGHVDGRGILTERGGNREALWLTIQADAEIMRYVVTKGFICLDGTSLTVVDVWPDRFNVMLVPHTQDHIVLPQRQVGDAINIEVDILGKYVEKLIAPILAGGQRSAATLTLEKLKEHGFQ
ncbi:riboflavin synthase [Acanthopleuribacter pedis]|uniref:Riboflavin synthase n=1 Tax=Acanthopleuribacter pedis TaxID=442870 RepID=A0A8J7U4H2_9BACT|nr:riboflavin synthase [Acanthopleuribacter pedis]MBO1319799.1 riboflavin synthase [Acanthopleuribacter pedis]